MEEIEPITTDEQYQRYLAEAEKLIAIDPPAFTLAGVRLLALAVRIEEYELREGPH